jgi:hypothetical protein
VSFTISYGPFVESRFPILFSYSVGRASTFDLEPQSKMTGNTFGIGAAAAFGFDHCFAPAGLQPTGSWGNNISFEVPVLTLVSSVSDTPPPPPTVVPEPASLLLMGNRTAVRGVHRFRMAPRLKPAQIPQSLFATASSSFRWAFVFARTALG